MPLEVHPDHGVPLALLGAHEHAVAQETRVVDHYVQAAKDIDGFGDEGSGLFPVGHVGAVGQGLAPHGADLFDDFIGGSLRGVAAVGGDP